MLNTLVFSRKYVPVTVDGMGRRYPITHVKIVDDLPNGNTLVIVKYPSWSVTGEITLETKAQLLGLRCLTGARVVAKPTDALRKFLETKEVLLVGPRENFWEHFKRMNVASQSDSEFELYYKFVEDEVNYRG